MKDTQTSAVDSCAATALGFEAALLRLHELGAARRLPVERVPLARAHGRVLAEDLSVATGADTRACVLSAGCMLTPARVALAAGHGVDRLAVSRRPTVAVFTCGDALVEPGVSLRPGQTYDSHREWLMGLLRAEGLEPVAWPRLPDDPQAVAIALRHAGHAFDLVLVCGGVSANGQGAVAAAIGSEALVHVSALRTTPALRLLCAESRPDAPPGVLDVGEYPSGSRKPLGEAVFLCLPDDALSIRIAMSTLCLSALDAMQGRREPRVRLRARMREARRKAHGVAELLPATLATDEHGMLWATPAAVGVAPGAQAAAEAHATASMHALIVLGEAAADIEPGDAVDATLG